MHPNRPVRWHCGLYYNRQSEGDHTNTEKGLEIGHTSREIREGPVVLLSQVKPLNRPESQDDHMHYLSSLYSQFWCNLPSHSSRIKDIAETSDEKKYRKEFEITWRRCAHITVDIYMRSLLPTHS